MLHVKFGVKCNWTVGSFLKIRTIFYKHISNKSYGNDAQINYLSIEPFLNFLAAFCVEKTRFLTIFFSSSEFGTRVYRGKIEARSEGISLHTFLRISLRKISILKRIKMNLIDINELYDMNVKKIASQFNEYFKTYYRNAKKNEKK